MYFGLTQIPTQYRDPDTCPLGAWPQESAERAPGLRALLAAWLGIDAMMARPVPLRAQKPRTTGENRISPICM